jgi:predicted permease
MLSILSTQKIFHPLKILKNVLTSPQVLACLLGMLWLIAGFPLPKVFASALNLVANASAPIGLMVVGAALNIKAVRGYEWPMILSSVTKLLLMPLSVMVLISWFGVSGLAAQVVVLYATLPAAAAATVLAARFGGNVPMASAIVTLETIVSMLSIPLLIQLARALFPT